MIEKRDFYIGGQWVAPKAGKDFDVIDPSTEEVCAKISLGGQADTDAAVAAARAAWEDWAYAPADDRIALLEKLNDVYKRRYDDMAQAMCLEMGAPVELAKSGQAGAGTWHMKDFIRRLKEFEYDRSLDNAPNDRILLEPIGVVAMITPWNWPMNQVTLKVIPALGVGCTCILKPSEIAPLSSLLFAEFIDEAGFPKGVFNLVNGDGAGVGSQLSAHPDVDMVSFTGSTRAGTAITKAAADSIKRVALELGGKGANIVFADADDKAVVRGVQHCFENTGQSCNAPTRMMVERARYDQAVEQARAEADATRVGSAHETGGHIGPAVSEAQFDKIQGLIQKGIDEGARLVSGGVGRPEGFNRGYYVRPTVFADVTPDMTIYKEEIFGPVLSMMPFEDESEAIRLANDTPYGLTNYVQTGDEAKGQRVARRLRSGMVQLNGKGRAPGTPFGGMKQSGNGREGGKYGIEEFLEVKAVSGWAAE